jgi:hypothetical protein
MIFYDPNPIWGEGQNPFALGTRATTLGNKMLKEMPHPNSLDHIEIF